MFGNTNTQHRLIYGICKARASGKFADAKLFVNTPDSVKGRLALWAKIEFGSLKELARRTGLNYAHLTQINDDKLPSGKITKPLAELGLSINWWLTGEGSMYATPANPNVLPGSDVDSDGVTGPEVNIQFRLIDGEWIPFLADGRRVEPLPKRDENSNEDDDPE